MLKKAASLVGENRLQEAITLYDKVLETDPGNVDALNEKGMVFMIVGQYGEAIIWFDKALEIDPGYVYPLGNKAASLYELGKYDEELYKQNSKMSS